MIDSVWISREDAENYRYVKIFHQLIKEMDFVEALECSVNLTMYALQSANEEMRPELVRSLIDSLERLASDMKKKERLNNDHNVQ
jgi:hypothetical protein